MEPPPVPCSDAPCQHSCLAFCQIPFGVAYLLALIFSVMGCLALAAAWLVTCGWCGTRCWGCRREFRTGRVFRDYSAKGADGRAYIEAVEARTDWEPSGRSCLEDVRDARASMAIPDFWVAEGPLRALRPGAVGVCGESAARRPAPEASSAAVLPV